MQPIALFAILSVLATGTVHAIPQRHHMPRSTPAPTAKPALAEVGLDLSPALIRLERQLDGAIAGAGEEIQLDDGQWHGDGIPTPAELAAPSPSETPSAWSESATPTSGWSEIPGPTATDPAAMDVGSSAMPTSSSASYSYTSFTPAMTSTTSFSPWSETTSTSSSVSAEPTSTSAGVKAAAEGEGEDEGEGEGEGEGEDKNQKAKKIRYKQCPSTGTVSEIKVTPCEGGKGTILDPCHFHAGSNYTIELSFVTPLDSHHPRSNLIARDRSMSNGPGSESFPYSGQSFDTCANTTCPIPANTSSLYTYEFVTLNDRFDQLTFNVTDGFEGSSMFCAYFPVTFVPNVVSRSLRMPFAGLGARGPW